MIAVWVAILATILVVAYIMFSRGSVEAPREEWKKSIHAPVIRGDAVLDEACSSTNPCAEGYYCSNGTCKIKNGRSCAYTSECSNTSFCFHGVCSTRPTVVQNLVLSNTPMVLEGTRFQVPSSWWNLRDMIDICPSPTDLDAFYILNTQGYIYRALQNNMQGHVEIPQMTVMRRIFTVGRLIFGTYEGGLYQLEDEKDRTWSWARINKLYGKDLTGHYISHLSSVDQVLSLITPNGILTHDSRRPNQWEEKPDILDITYGRTRDIYIARYRDQSLIFHQGEKEHVLPPETVDWAVNRQDDQVVYLVTDQGDCFSQSYRTKDGADQSSLRLIGGVRRIVFYQKLWAISAYTVFD